MKMKTTLELLKLFITAYYEKRDVQGALAYVTDDVRWFPATQHADITKRAEAVAPMSFEVAAAPKPFKIELDGEYENADTGAAFLRFTATGNGTVISRRVTATSACENGENKLCTIHMSAIDTSAQLDNLINIMPGGVAMYRYKDGNFELFYQAAGVAQLLGRTADDEKALMKIETGSCIYPADLKNVKSAIKKTLTDAGTITVSYRAKHKDRSYIWITASYRRTGVQDGLPIIHAAFTELSSQHQLYHALAEEAGLAIVVSDLKTHELLYANNTTFSYFDRPLGESFMGQTCYSYFFGRKERCEFCKADCFEKNMLHKEQIYIPDLDRYFTVNGTIIDWGGREAFIEYIDNVTDVEKTREQLTDLVLNVACGLVVSTMQSDGSFEIQYVNNGLCNIYEAESPEEFVPRFKENSFMGVLPEDLPAVKKLEEDAVYNHMPSETTYRCVVENGELKWINIKVNCVLHQDGSYTLYATYSDITREMRLQRQFADIIHTVPGGICLYRWDGENMRPIIVSDHFSDLLGDDAMNVLNTEDRLDFKHVHPDDLPALQAAIRTALADTHTIDYSYRSYNSKLKKYLWLHVRGNTVLQDDGTQLAYVTYTDETQAHENVRLLAESEQAIEYASAQTHLWYWRYNVKTGAAYMGSLAQHDFGCGAVVENFMQTAISSGFIEAEYQGEFKEAIAAIERGEPQVTLEVRCFLKDGRHHWVRMCFTNMYDEKGGVNTAVCTSVPIDVEKELQAKYELERARPILGEDNLDAHSLFNLTTDEVLEHAHNGEVANEDEDEHKTTKFSEAVALFAAHIKDPLQREEFLALNNAQNLLNEFANGEASFTLEYVLTELDGREHWARNVLHLMRDPANGDLLMFEYRYNIENEKMQRLMYRSIAADNYEFVARINCKTGEYVIYPASREDVGFLPPTGYNADEAAAELAAHLPIPEDRELVLEHTTTYGIRAHLKGKDRFSLVYREPGDEGDDGYKYKRITIYYLDREREIVVVLREDLTALLKEEAEKNELLRHALDAANQASQAKSQFLSRMSHELRTPMNAIIGLSALASGDVNNPAAMEDAIGKIGMSARYLLSLINDILEMSRIESGRMTLNEAPFDFEQLISSVNTIIYGQATQKGVDYDAIAHGFTEPTYIGDATKLQQILINVLGNSVKFTPPGGKITLAIEQVRRTHSGATLRFTVSDTGCGIDEEFLPHLFDAFSQESASFTSTSTGTGLGLAITKSMVDMMNGSISVQSIKNIGSVFTIDVQLGISEESRTALDLITSMNLSKLKVLVVDDDVVVCQSTEKILSSMGMQAQWVDSGAAAVENVEAAHLEHADYDTIFIDWKMPDMDGIETTREIRKIVGPDVTIIIMTAYDWSSIEARARESGVDMFLEKPLFQSSIISAFEKIFAHNKEKIEPKPRQTFDFTGRRILLAEDHPLNVEVAKRLLEKVGFDVTVANNGLEAIEAFTTADDNYFDAILMDVRMPVMDGLTAARNLRSLKKEGSKTIPIIAMTANAFDEDVEQSLAHGMDAHMTKPIDPQLLYYTLNKFIELSHGVDGRKPKA